MTPIKEPHFFAAEVRESNFDPNFAAASPATPAV